MNFKYVDDLNMRVVKCQLMVPSRNLRTATKCRTTLQGLEIKGHGNKRQEKQNKKSYVFSYLEGNDLISHSNSILTNLPVLLRKEPNFLIQLHPTKNGKTYACKQNDWDSFISIQGPFFFFLKLLFIVCCRYSTSAKNPSRMGLAGPRLTPI